VDGAESCRLFRVPFMTIVAFAQDPSGIISAALKGEKLSTYTH